MAASPCGWEISRYKQKGNRTTAYKQASGEYDTHEVVPFAEVILAKIPKPTHRALRGGERWHKGDAAPIKGVWVGRSIRRLEPCRRHEAEFRSNVKGPPWDAQQGSAKKGTHRHPFWLEKTVRNNADVPNTAADSQSGAAKETDDCNDVPMRETPLSVWSTRSMP